jgi:hypothetical protein
MKSTIALRKMSTIALRKISTIAPRKMDGQTHPFIQV